MSSELKTETMCEVLKVSRSGYYDWLSRAEIRDEANKNAQCLAEEVKTIFVQSRGTYGHRSILKEIRNSGGTPSRRSVLRALKTQGLKAVPRRSKPYPKSEEMPEHKTCKNRLGRKFSAKRANRYWVGDITYLWTGEGWLYLATVLDLFSRKVIGWSISDKADTQLTLAALKDAIANRPFRRWRLMFHSDQGCQYTSKEFREFLTEEGVLQSMSRRGQCWDNAAMESFFGSLKQETGLGRWPLSTAKETRYVIFDWIECWYNVKRRHSKLGYISPSGFERSTTRAA